MRSTSSSPPGTAGRVRVEWIHPGWGANWNADARHAESALAGADVLVLMSMVRTNLGRHMRRVASELSRPWVACTGTGRASVQGAIEQAVQLIDERSAAAS